MRSPWQPATVTRRRPIHPSESPTLDCKAVLIDLDGTLVDSAPRILRVWEGWARRNGLDFDHVRGVLYGRRSVDTVRLVAPWLQTDREVAALEAEETSDMRDLRLFPGAAALMQRLQGSPHAIVTSGSRATAQARLQHAGLPIPGVLISAEDIAAGKPAPDGYLLAAAQLGVEPRDCVVLEDSPVGIQAGKAAGMRVIAVASTHKPDELGSADIVVAELSGIDLDDLQDHLELAICLEICVRQIPP